MATSVKHISLKDWYLEDLLGRTLFEVEVEKLQDRDFGVARAAVGQGRRGLQHLTNRL